MGFAVAVITLIGGMVWWNQTTALSGAFVDPLVFNQPFIKAGTPWILPGGSRQFEVMLRNRSRADVWADELRFSCPCASGTVAGSRRLPVKVRRRDSVPVNITVKSEKGESGSLELRFGVVGRAGQEAVEAGALATVTFVQPLNAQPMFVSLGKLSTNAEAQQHTVTLWGPRELAFSGTVMADSDDPCVTVTVEPVCEEESVDSPRKEIVQLSIAVNPEKAPERPGARVEARSCVPLLCEQCRTPKRHPI